MPASAEQSFATTKAFADTLPVGWFSDFDIGAYRSLIRELPDGATIVEVGVWEGRSMCSIADLILQKGITAIAVDTFLGVVLQSHAYGDAPAERAQARFERNVGIFGLSPIVYRMTSAQAAATIDRPIDLTMIDADHEYESVYRDIRLWAPKTSRILCGHDYDAYTGAHPGVKRAVDEAFPHMQSISYIWFVKGDAHGR